MMSGEDFELELPKEETCQLCILLCVLEWTVAHPEASRVDVLLPLIKTKSDFETTSLPYTCVTMRPNISAVFIATAHAQMQVSFPGPHGPIHRSESSASN